jgi:hypothetical protein
MKSICLVTLFTLALAVVAQEDGKRVAVITYPFPTSGSQVTPPREGPQFLKFGPGQVVHIVNRYQVSQFELFSENPVNIHLGHCDKFNVTQFEFICDQTLDIQITDLRDPRDPNAGPNSVRIIWPGNPVP